MRAGRLRHRIILQSPAGTRDAVGERVTTWTNVATVSAAVEPLSAREQFLASQAQASTTHRVTLRYASQIAAIDASWRIMFGTRVFVLDSVRNIEERNREIELMATEGLRSE